MNYSFEKILIEFLSCENMSRFTLEEIVKILYPDLDFDNDISEKDHKLFSDLFTRLNQD